MSLNYSPRVITDGLIFYVDAANPISYPGTGTNWSDISKNNNDGTLTNGPTFDSANGGSIVFDGSDDFSNIGKDSLLRPNDAYLNSKGFSIDVWVNLSSGGATNGIFCNDGEGQSTYYGLECSFNSSNQLNMHKFDGTGLGSTDRSSIITNNSYSLNKWYHVVFNYVSADKNDFKIYVDGEEQSSSASGTGGSVGYSSTYNGAIGKSRIYPINGKISNVRVYNRKLLLQEVLQNYNSTKWRFQ